MDFAHDQLTTGRRLRVFTAVDTLSQLSPVLDPHFNYCGQDEVRTLEEVCGKAGYPKAIRVDQGLEFSSLDLEFWAYQKGVTLDLSRPGKPTDNAFIEPFNGKLRTECLNVHWFTSLDDAPTKMEDWSKGHNEVHPTAPSATTH